MIIFKLFFPVNWFITRRGYKLFKHHLNLQSLITFKEIKYLPKCMSYISKKYINISVNNSKLNKNNINFEEWLVGFTDGDGTFNIYISKDNKLTFTYKLSQSIYNEQLLYKIKSKLGVGNINKSLGMSNYVIRKKEHLINIIIPIFDKNMLLSSKQFNYLKFKDALYISLNKNISNENKIILIKEIKDRKIPINYKSPIWNNLNISDIKSITNVYKYMSKSWLIGFIEAEGSFYLVKKDSKRIVHGFGITQKLDPIILHSIKYILNIPTDVKFREPKYSNSYYYILDTTNSKAIENIINFSINNNHDILYLGAKNLEFSIWKRSYFKYKGNYIYLLKIHKFINKIKNKHKILS